MWLMKNLEALSGFAMKISTGTGITVTLENGRGGGGGGGLQYFDGATFCFHV